MTITSKLKRLRNKLQGKSNNLYNNSSQRTQKTINRTYRGASKAKNNMKARSVRGRQAIRDSFLNSISDTPRSRPHKVVKKR